LLKENRLWACVVGLSVNLLPNQFFLSPSKWFFKFDYISHTIGLKIMDRLPRNQSHWWRLSNSINSTPQFLEKKINLDFVKFSFSKLFNIQEPPPPPLPPHHRSGLNNINPPWCIPTTHQGPSNHIKWFGRSLTWRTEETLILGFRVLDWLFAQSPFS